MKLECTMKVKVIAKGSEQSKDGKTTYYRLLVRQGMEAGKLGCPEDTYNLIKEDETYIFNVQYNDEYKSFRITGIAPETYNTKTPSTTIPAEKAPTGSATK